MPVIIEILVLLHQAPSIPESQMLSISLCVLRVGFYDTVILMHGNFWTLPKGDADFPKRRAKIKRYASFRVGTKNVPTLHGYPDRGWNWGIHHFLFRSIPTQSKTVEWNKRSGSTDPGRDHSLTSGTASSESFSGCNG